MQALSQSLFALMLQIIPEYLVGLRTPASMYIIFGFLFFAIWPALIVAVMGTDSSKTRTHAAVVFTILMTIFIFLILFSGCAAAYAWHWLSGALNLKISSPWFFLAAPASLAVYVFYSKLVTQPRMMKDMDMSMAFVELCSDLEEERKLSGKPAILEKDIDTEAKNILHLEERETASTRDFKKFKITQEAVETSRTYLKRKKLFVEKRDQLSEEEGKTFDHSQWEKLWAEVDGELTDVEKSR